jgi:hypothetical protein
MNRFEPDSFGPGMEVENCRKEAPLTPGLRCYKYWLNHSIAKRIASPRPGSV